MAVLDRTIDDFIPPELAAERETRQRARMFLISHILGPFIGLVIPLALWLLDARPGPDVGVLALAIAAFWVFPFVLRATGRYTLLCFISIQNLIFCMLLNFYFNGGAQSPTLPWVLTVPLLSFLYLGPSAAERAKMLLLYLVNFSVFVALCLTGLPPPRASMTSLEGLGLVSVVTEAVYVAMMALYYAKILASGVELEAEMRGHLATAAELRQATAAAERAGAAKAEFLAKMSHELRTPLNAVIGYSQMLLEDAETEGDAAGSEDLNRIHAAGQHLLRLVNDVLDLSKAEAGKLELAPEPFDVAELLEAVVAGCGGEARKGVALTFSAQGQLGTITADARRIQQVLIHVVENGLKFTETGEVRITAFRRPGPDTAAELVLRVADTGIGIAPDALEAMFETFSVADDSTTSKYGGTGLGLSLSRRLWTLMGGRISVESALGVGTCVTLSLPAAPCADIPGAISASPSTGGDDESPVEANPSLAA